MAAKPRGRRRAAERGKQMTSVELPPALLLRARLYAVRHRMTFRALVEEALRARLARKEDEKE